MAHTHECRHCEEKFVCPKSADECFDEFLTCKNCGGNTAVRFLWVAALVAIAVSLTVLFFKLIME